MLFKSKLLSDGQIAKHKRLLLEACESDDHVQITESIEVLLKACKKQKKVALLLINFINQDCLPIDDALNFLSEIYDIYVHDDEIIEVMGRGTESAREINFLNDFPPKHELFENLTGRLLELSLKYKGDEREVRILDGLSTTARLCARQKDDIAERSYKRLVDLKPNVAWPYYSLGLFYKTRGRFEEGAAANQKAINIAEEPTQAYFWNLGICATGMGDAETALRIWKGQGQNIEMGRFNLPEGGYPSCKVRLAEFPLAERNKDNDYPGQEETIWIERLSPCHGIIRSVLYSNLGVDYGDVILFDGAPITYHKVGEEQIPVHPHISTLLKRNYQFYDFCGMQSEQGALSQASEQLDSDAVIYSHTESYQLVCMECWLNPDTEHKHDQSDEKPIIKGRIAAPPEIAPADLLNQIDTAFKDNPENRIFSPDLCQAAGFVDRARIEQLRFDSLSLD